MRPRRVPCYRVIRRSVLGVVLVSAQLGAQTIEPFVRGDVTGDGKLMAVDALGALSHVVGKTLPETFRASPNGDANCDDHVSAMDALIILSAAVGKDVSVFCVGYSDVTASVGTTGGTVEYPSGALVTIPPGVLPEAWRVSVQKVPSDSSSGGTFALDMARTQASTPSALPQAAPPISRTSSLGDIEFSLPLRTPLATLDGLEVKVTLPNDPLTYYAHSPSLLTGGTKVGLPLLLPEGGSLKAHFSATVEVPTALCDEGLYMMLPAREDPGIDASRIPVVFIHGWQPFKTSCPEWVFDFNPDEPGTAVFQHLNDIGAAGQFQYWRYTYPTYNSVDHAGERLAAFLAGSFPGRSDVVLIAHSMGGLVARSAIGLHGADAQIGRLITLGTPHHGSPQADVSFWIANATARNPFEWMNPLSLAPHWAALFVAPWRLGTIGARDLRASSGIVTTLDALEEPRNRYHTFGGDLSATGLHPCGHGLRTCAGYALANGAYRHSGIEQSDAIVPRSSALLEGTWPYPKYGAGYDHTEMWRGNYDGANFPSSGDPLLAKVAELVVTAGNPGLGHGLGPDQFVLIQPGTFQMGDPNGSYGATPVHTVNITSAFYLQTTEVTRGQWRKVMGEPSEWSWQSTCGDTCPASARSWDEFQVFLSRLNEANPGANYRLPTEAEWEYAARAGSSGDYGGNGVLDDMGWYDANSAGKIHPVAQKRPNAWGLYDMHGNVREWVQDWYNAGYYAVSPVNDPTGPDSGEYRVHRGGSFGENATSARVAYRLGTRPSSLNWAFGFRLARSPAGVSAFAHITAGANQTCALTGEGAAFCWGDNQYGQLGNGTTSNRGVPDAVAGGLSFSSLTAGGGHACGLTGGGVAYCWGYNGQGQLGDGTDVYNSTTPVQVAGGLTFVLVSAGNGHTCGLTAVGAAYCWGHNEYGQLGNGESAFSRSVPTPVLGGLVFETISAGGMHTCGVTGDGAAYCWGSNSQGQLGDGTTTERLSPTPVAGGREFHSLTAGQQGMGNTCGLTTGGVAYCWGWNAHGQLGDGTNADRHTPTAVAGGFGFSGITAADGYHTCGLTTGAAAYCWGFGGGGALGLGDILVRHAPAPVVGQLVFATVTGGRHSCGLTSGGAAYCWGPNDMGQLGDGTTDARTAPTPVMRP